MTKDEVKSNWYYFCALARQFAQTEQYVDHIIDDDQKIINGGTFSNEFAKILLLASAEFENIAKSIVREVIGSGHDNDNMPHITKLITEKFPKIGETIIVTPYMTIKPLKDWDTEEVIEGKDKKSKVLGVDWWRAHNNIKHKRYYDYDQANLRNCIYALSSLMVLELYLSQVVIGDIAPIRSIRCEYFEFYYAGDYLTMKPKELPDFAEKL